jgi:hypothetical protein
LADILAKLPELFEAVFLEGSALIALPGDPKLSRSGRAEEVIDKASRDEMIE